jgi:hypothetical protein
MSRESSSSSSYRLPKDWIVQELGKKVDKDWILRELTRLQIVSEKNEQLVREAQDATQSFARPSDLSELRGTTSSLSRWIRGGLIALLSFTISVGGTALWQYSAMYTRLELAEKEIIKLREANMVMDAEYGKKFTELAKEADEDAVNILRSLNELSVKFDSDQRYNRHN